MSNTRCTRCGETITVIKNCMCMVNDEKARESNVRADEREKAFKEICDMLESLKVEEKEGQIFFARFFNSFYIGTIDKIMALSEGKG